jgi:hypothetical protein
MKETLRVEVRDHGAAENRSAITRGSGVGGGSSERQPIHESEYKSADRYLKVPYHSIISDSHGCTIFVPFTPQFSVSHPHLTRNLPLSYMINNT